MRNKIILVVILAISMLNLSGCFKSDIDDYLATIEELKTEAEKLSDNLEVLTTKDEFLSRKLYSRDTNYNFDFYIKSELSQSGWDLSGPFKEHKRTNFYAKYIDYLQYEISDTIYRLENEYNIDISITTYNNISLYGDYEPICSIIIKNGIVSSEDGKYILDTIEQAFKEVDKDYKLDDNIINVSLYNSLNDSYIELYNNDKSIITTELLTSIMEV